MKKGRPSSPGSFQPCPKRKERKKRKEWSTVDVNDLCSPTLTRDEMIDICQNYDEAQYINDCQHESGNRLPVLKVNAMIPHSHLIFICQTDLWNKMKYMIETLACGECQYGESRASLHASSDGQCIEWNLHSKPDDDSFAISGKVWFHLSSENAHVFRRLLKVFGISIGITRCYETEETTYSSTMQRQAAAESLRYLHFFSAYKNLVLRLCGLQSNNALSHSIPQIARIITECDVDSFKIRKMSATLLDMDRILENAMTAAPMDKSRKDNDGYVTTVEEDDLSSLKTEIKTEPRDSGSEVDKECNPEETKLVSTLEDNSKLLLQDEYGNSRCKEQVPCLIVECPICGMGWRSKLDHEVAESNPNAPCSSEKNGNSESDSRDYLRGERIVELAVLAKHLWCVSCKELLSLENIEGETRRGMSSILNVRCHKCLLLNQVPTGKHHADACGSTNVSDRNSKPVIGVLHAGLGWTKLNKILACLNIPPIEFNTFKGCE